ncbi:SusE domain-containing protein [Aquimarina brevivitae]|uniref:Uncharacterized protein DUF5019 n=1 Tax=Aquimarina brevivitae TaxID=323412 RepID=A0A4Q7NYL7_9FLAO|nr:SusE domain-containing protein [Aquimarina brevivitae]RZS92551.1 uncharacterized protein DUF5019 [Aquimarina brevivitae]
MKKILILLLGLVIVTCFNSCIEDDEPTFMINEEAIEAPLLVTPNSSVNLDQESADQQALTIVWEDANYNFETPVTYNIEVTAAGEGFDTPIEAAQTSERYYSWTVGELNSLAIAAGLEADTEGNLNIRVVSSLGTNDGVPADSNVLVITLTPYSTIIPVKDLFLVGNATAADWNNDNNNPPIVRNPANENDFSFKGRFLGGGDLAFKLLEIRGQWQPQWGTNDGTTVEVNDGTGSDPGVFSVPAEGYYEFNINIDDRTFSVSPYDASGATDYTAIGIGIIGSATPNGWDDDTDMTQSTFDSHLWYINDIVLIDGEAKFRTNSDWSTNWGADTALTGYGNQDGPNIPVTAGTYDVWFNDLDGSYVFILKN